MSQLFTPRNSKSRNTCQDIGLEILPGRCLLLDRLGWRMHRAWYHIIKTALSEETDSLTFMDHAFLLGSPCSKTKNPCYILLHLVQVTIEKMVDEDLVQITHPRHR